MAMTAAASDAPTHATRKSVVAQLDAVDDKNLPFAWKPS